MLHDNILIKEFIKNIYKHFLNIHGFLTCIIKHSYTAPPQIVGKLSNPTRAGQAWTNEDVDRGKTQGQQCRNTETVDEKTPKLDQRWVVLADERTG